MGSVLISGGQLFNKGAQAMTYTLINEIHNQYPQKSIVLLSSADYFRSDEEKKQFCFDIMPFDLTVQLPMLKGIYGIACKVLLNKHLKKWNLEIVRDMKEIFQNADVMFDISGYALSSARGFQRSLQYIITIIIAKQFGIPMYILPQSFGPFNYPGLLKKLLISTLMATYMTYPKAIYAREHEGYSEINKYTKINLFLCDDIVLQRKNQINTNDIYTSYSSKEEISIVRKAVCIIPNKNIMIRIKQDRIYLLYYKILDCLIKEGFTIYLLRHSAEDKYICDELKNKYAEEEKVVVINEEYDCIQLESILGKFDFLISSRYHAIIHSYRNCIPVVALSWATKYKELLINFEQSKYYFDAREQISEGNIISALKNMCRNYQRESQIIKKHIDEIRKKDILKTLLDKEIIKDE